MSKRTLAVIFTLLGGALAILMLVACGAGGTTSTTGSPPTTTGSTSTTAGTNGSTSTTAGTAGSTSTTGGQGAISHPTAANELVLRIDTAGGLTPPQMSLAHVPQLSLFGDGRVIETGPVPAIYPPAALPNLQTTIVFEGAVQAILADAKKAGLLANDVDYGQPRVFDLPSTAITINANGANYHAAIYALGFEENGESSPADIGLTPEQVKARKAAHEFVGRLQTLTAFVQTEPRFEQYTFLAIAIHSLNADSFQKGPSGVEPNRLDWPLADLATAGTPDERYGKMGYRKLIVSGKDLDTLMPLLKQATTITLWQSGGHQYQLALQPLLPDQTSTTVGQTTTTAGGTSTTGTTTRTSSTTADPALEEYRAEMRQWGSNSLLRLDTGATHFQDPSHPTVAEISALESFAGRAQQVLGLLLKIQAPDSIAALHAQFVKAFEDLVTATQKYADALQSGDAQAAQAAEQLGKTAQSEMNQAMTALTPVVGSIQPVP